MPSNLELLGRLLLAAVLGAGLGADQELRGQPAGMRTHTLLAIGACLFTLVSAYGFGGSADPSRLAAQVIAGIGFIGGGVIVRQGINVAGLTTAASIWVTASMGLVIGFGRYLLTVAGVLLTVGALSGLRMFQTLLRHWAGSRERYVLSTNASFSVGLVVEVAQHERVAMRALERRATGTGGQIVLLAGLPPRYHPERLVELLAGLEGVHEVEWKHEAGR